MSEQTFRSPGFFEREIDLSQASENITGIPAGIVGTAKLGPAFVPVLIGNKTSLREKFGKYDSKYYGLIAAENYLEYGSAVMYVRVLGAGGNSTEADITATEKYGTVKSAGFRLSGSLEYWQDDNGAHARRNENRTVGNVQFIAAQHEVNEDDSRNGYPIFKHNDSIGNKKYPNLIRGMVFLASGARMEIMDYDENYNKRTPDDIAKIKGEIKTLIEIISLHFPLSLSDISVCL